MNLADFNRIPEQPSDDKLRGVIKGLQMVLDWEVAAEEPQKYGPISAATGY